MNEPTGQSDLCVSLSAAPRSADRGRNGSPWALLALGLAVFVLLLVWRRETLNSPPYWDQAFGLWMEANFLAETDFDYHRLRTVEPPGTLGGSRGYVVSILPTALAVLMRSAPSTDAVLVVAHLVNLVLATIAIVGVFAVARKLAGSLCASLLAALALTVPVFSAQVELVGLEIPVAACSVVALWLVSQGRLRTAVLACWAAFFMKATGMMFTWALTLALHGLWLRDRARGRQTPGSQTATVFMALASSGLQIGLAAWGTMVDVNRQPQVHAWFANYSLLPHWCPDVLLWLVACALGGVWLVWRGRSGLRAAPPRSQSAPESADRNLAPTVAGLVIVGVLAAVLVFSFMPRYLVPIVPCLAIVTAWLIHATGVSRGHMAAVLAVAVLLCLENQEGRFFPAIETGIGPGFARTGAVLERSLEYRTDHRQNIRLVRELAERHAQETIVAGHPFVYFLSLPRLGYVAQPLHGYTINPFTPLVEHFRDVTFSDHADIDNDAVFVYAPNTWYRYSARWDLAPPTAADAVVAGETAPGAPVAYRVNWQARSVNGRMARQRWFVRRLWPWRTPIERAVRTAEYWTARGELVEAARAVQDASDRAGGSPELDVLLGNAWLDAQQFDLAARGLLLGQRNRLAATLDAGDDAASVAGERAEQPTDELLKTSLIDLSEGRLAEAVAIWRAVARTPGSGGRAGFWLGLAEQACDHHEAAIGHFNSALSVCNAAGGHETMALARLTYAISNSRLHAANDLSVQRDEVGALQSVCKSNRTPATEQFIAEAHHELGLVLARRGQRAEAAEHFRQALQGRPDWSAVRDDLLSVER